MRDLHAPPLDRTQGVRTDRAAYSADFWQRYGRIYQRDSWKLERREHFVELNNPSWDAFRRGDWDQALRLLENKREGLRKAAEQDRKQRTVFHRVRVVGLPLTPYLQWELHSLRLKAEYDEVIRIVDAARLATVESEGPLPELVVLGGLTLYEVVYTDAGVLDGGVRYTRPDLVQGWEAAIRTLFENGEDIADFFAREVAPLPPPQPTTE
ncbi:DUF6879 family protein [Streptomyces hoynatensis]|uniref:DUF6879 domain-containing protein n=1 Tax=Streptomyces hoynatensis TaxID=1141874 RepID=A0A3A9YX14_9ACTN|nr:DUF6879 family protein [Streptomyces hoynatensis]RKN40359.1 hypothetical protein D7294_18035 [Streptomyces hoynatensis]